MGSGEGWDSGEQSGPFGQAVRRGLSEDGTLEIELEDERCPGQEWGRVVPRQKE